MSAIGELRATDPFGMAGQGPPRLAPGRAARLDRSTAAHAGDLNVLNIVAHTASPFRADLTGQLLDLTNHLHWVGDAVRAATSHLSAWGMAGPLGSITGHLAGSGDLNSFNAHGPVNPRRAARRGCSRCCSTAATPITCSPPSAWKRATSSLGRARQRRRHDRHRRARPAAGPERAAGASSAGRSRAAIRRCAAPRGTFTLQGVLPYRVHVSGECPRRRPAADAAGCERHARQGSLRVRARRGRPVRRSRQRQRRGDVGAAGRPGTSAVAPPASTRARCAPTCPGSLSFDFSTTGRGFDAKGAFTASFSDLSGKLRGADGQRQRHRPARGKTWSSATCASASDGATSPSMGRSNERMNLRFALTTQDLSLLAAGSRGQLKASGTLDGTLADPAIVGDRARPRHRLRRASSSRRSMRASTSIRPRPTRSRRSRHGCTSSATRRAPSRRRRSRCSGPPSAYSVHLSAERPRARRQACRRAGPTRAAAFDGQLTALALNGNDALHLSLERPVGPDVSRPITCASSGCAWWVPRAACARTATGTRPPGRRPS